MSVKIVKNLSLWFQQNARDLPWRRAPEFYRVWLSEIMLQQTRVATALPYYEKFISEFPTVVDLADAPLERVLKLWAGLGYYSRARNLHRGAQAVRDRLKEGLGFPRTAEEWGSIPGVGPYTAGAVASIVSRERTPIVDGNVVRVLSRVYAISEVDSKKTRIWELSRNLVRRKESDPRILNQALMELGALICLPKNPKCGECPIRAECRGKSDPGAFPKKSAAKTWKHLQEKKWIPVRKKKGIQEVLLIQNRKGAWREGLWDFPAPDSQGISSGVLVAEFTLRYVVTHHKVERTHRLIRVPAGDRIRVARGEWFLLTDPPAVPAPVRKALALIEETLNQRQDRRPDHGRDQGQT